MGRFVGVARGVTQRLGIAERGAVRSVLLFRDVRREGVGVGDGGVEDTLSARDEPGAKAQEPFLAIVSVGEVGDAPEVPGVGAVHRLPEPAVEALDPHLVELPQLVLDPRRLALGGRPAGQGLFDERPECLVVVGHGGSIPGDARADNQRTLGSEANPVLHPMAHPLPGEITRRSHAREREGSEADGDRRDARHDGGAGSDDALLLRFGDDLTPGLVRFGHMQL